MTLTITDVTLSVVRLDLIHEFETSSHRKGHLDHIVVRVTALADGRRLTGWGECASPSAPFYCGESTTSCWHALADHLVPLLLGRPFDDPHQAGAILAKVRGNHFARAGLEMACWDLYAQTLGLPLTAVLGGRATRVAAGVSLGIEPTIDDLLARVAGHVAEGYRRVKLKIRPGWDVEPVRAVRAAFPDLPLQVDANAGYDVAETDRLLALEPFGLLMIEQPYDADDLLAHARLAALLDTPVCLDESLTSPAVTRTALELGACRIANIKVSRLGGLGPAVAVHDLCVEAGVPVWCGGMHEFGIGRAANLALAALPGFTLPSDISGSDKYYVRDLVRPPIRAHDGMVAVPVDSPGLGLAVDEDLLARATLRSIELTAADAVLTGA